MSRRLSTVVVVALASLSMWLMGASSAFAVGTTPVPSWMTDGRLYASVTGGDRIYLGGEFTQLRSAPLGTPASVIPVSNLGAIDLTTGEGVPGFTTAVTHATYAPFVRDMVLSPDGSRLYIGGRFDAVNGEKRRNVAAIDTSDGSVIASFKPRVGSLKNQVFSLLLSPDGSTLYIGGKFGKVTGVVHTNIAAVNTANGSLLDWSSTPNDSVRSMDFSSDGDTIFMVGAFSAVDSQARESIARIDTATGALDPWFVPGFLISGPPMTGWSVDATATAVYGGFGRGPNWFGAYRVSDGSQVFRRSTVGNVQKVMISPDGTQLFVGGHFGTGGLTQTFTECGSTPFRGLLIASPANGTVSCSWIPQLEPYGSNYEGVWDFTLTAEHLWFVGNFTHVGGVAQANVARLPLSTP